MKIEQIQNNENGAAVRAKINTALKLTGINDFEVGTVINDPTMGAATITNLSTSQAIKDYVQASIGSSLTTSLSYGGIISINGGDDTLIEITAGAGVIIDDTFPSAPVITKIEFAAIPAFAPAHAATQLTYLAIDNTGALIQQTTLFTQSQRRQLIVLGGAVSLNGVNVDSVNDLATNTGDGYLIRSLMQTMGVINIDGNQFLPAGVNLQLQRTEGTVFANNVNRNIDTTNPHNKTFAAATPITFSYAYSNGAGGSIIVPNVLNIVPGQYDNGSGVLQGTGNNNWTNQVIYFFPNSNLAVIQYGNELYATLDEARADQSTVVPLIISTALRPAFMRTVIALKGNTVNLSLTENHFYQTTKFGQL